MSISPGWLESFKSAIEGFILPPAFTGPFSSTESIAGLVAAAGFTHVDVQSIKVEHTDDMGRYLKFIGEVARDTLQGEVGEKYAAYMRKRYGDGDFTLTSEAFVITAEKP
jgi:hypothetical protein